MFLTITKRLAPYHEELQKIESSDLYLSGDPKTVENQLRKVFQTYMYNPDAINQLNLGKSQQATLNGFKVFEIFSEQIFMKPFNLFNDLSELKIPTLIIHGDSDPIPFITAEHLKNAIPLSKLVKIEQCGHFPFVEQPDILFRTISEFLQSNVSE